MHSRQALEKFRMTKDEVDLIIPTPKTWVALLVIDVVGEEKHAEFLEQASDFHRLVSGAAAAHMNLTASNTFRTPWLAAKLLSKDPEAARDAAKQLLKLLATTPPEARTCFEECIIEDPSLWANLTKFATRDPPTLLWHSKLEYEALFRFIGPRFLLAPDHVLDTERIHARWQWACSVKRGQTMQALNAELRLRHYLEHNLEPPDFEDLNTHLIAERQDVRQRLQTLTDSKDIALGCRSSWIYRARLNLSAAEHRLVEALHDPTSTTGSEQYGIAWRNYLRQVLTKDFIYTVSFKPSVFLYVVDNKIVAGREVRDGKVEALGSKLVFGLFEAMPGEPHLFRRVHREIVGMRQDLLTLAELLATLGCSLPEGLDLSANAREQMLEAYFQNLTISKWRVEEEVYHEEPLIFAITDEQDAEDAMAFKADAQACTKMTLARLMQRNDGLGEGQSLQDAFKLSKEDLIARSAHLFPAPVVEGPPPGPRGRGARGGRGPRGGRGRRGRGMV